LEILKAGERGKGEREGGKEKIGISCRLFLTSLPFLPFYILYISLFLSLYSFLFGHTWPYSSTTSRDAAEASTGRISSTIQGKPIFNGRKRQREREVERECGRRKKGKAGL
jgi:hypothetical protein